MKKQRTREKLWTATLLTTVLLLTALSMPAFAEGEKIVTLGAGADDGWRRISRMDGVEVQTGLRPQPVLISAHTRGVPIAINETERTGESPRTALAGTSSGILDLALTFDEMDPRRYRDTARHYAVSTSAGVYSAPLRWAYSGSSAAVFDRNGNAFVTVKSASPDALLSDNNRIGSFTLEFFLFPRVVESNAEVFLWNAAVSAGKNQFIRASVVRNRISLIFDEFFRSADNTKSIAMRLSAKTSLVPEKYSHHLVRFDRDTGLIEYVVDGTLEDARYTTENGREGNPAYEIYEPYTGRSGELIIGKGFNGIIDEFNLYSGFVETIDTARFSKNPGWAESETIDLGSAGASVLRITATGGYTDGKTNNRYVGSFGGQNASITKTSAAAETFPDSSAIQIFIRAQETPFGWEGNEWTAVRPGSAVNVRGRYVQLSMAFYPSADRSGVPYLSGLSLVYKTVEPPSPPALVNAAAGDGYVDLTWKRNAQPEVEGYLVYIGTKSGEYWERSPIDAGNAASLHIDGLENGVLYYFAVSAYTGTGQIAGIFSKEIRARPLSVVR